MLVHILASAKLFIPTPAHTVKWDTILAPPYVLFFASDFVLQAQCPTNTMAKYEYDLTNSSSRLKVLG